MASLEILFQQMADLTRPKCGECRAPLSCCDPMYCDLAADEIKRAEATVLETGHDRLKYMGPHGCVVPPYLRPLCTLHVCSINSFGFDPKDMKFTTAYFRLRAKIDKATRL